jgi:hypothetical protein
MNNNHLSTSDLPKVDRTLLFEIAKCVDESLQYNNYEMKDGRILTGC